MGVWKPFEPEVAKMLLAARRRGESRVVYSANRTLYEANLDDLRQTNLLTSFTRPMRWVPGLQFQWEMKNGLWVDYEDEENDIVVAAKKAGRGKIRYPARGFEYEIDLDSMVQENISMNSSVIRRVRICGADISSDERAPRTNSDGAVDATNPDCTSGEWQMPPREPSRAPAAASTESGCRKPRGHTFGPVGEGTERESAKPSSYHREPFGGFKGSKPVPPTSHFAGGDGMGFGGGGGGGGASGGSVPPPPEASRWGRSHEKKPQPGGAQSAGGGGGVHGPTPGGKARSAWGPNGPSPGFAASTSQDGGSSKAAKAKAKEAPPPNARPQAEPRTRQSKEDPPPPKRAATGGGRQPMTVLPKLPPGVELPAAPPAAREAARNLAISFAELRRASPAERKRAYKTAILRWHPDKNLEDEDVATEVFQFLQALKEWCLSDA